jgi:hypothetical protein
MNATPRVLSLALAASSWLAACGPEAPDPADLGALDSGVDAADALDAARDAALDVGATDAGADAGYSAPAIPPLGWTSLGEPAPDDSGRVGALTTPLEGGERFVAVRVRPGWGERGEPREPAACYQLEDVRAGDASLVAPALASGDWGEVCADCAHRVRRTPHHGLFAFPNDGAPLPDAAALSLVAAARQCADGTPFSPSLAEDMPDTLRVEVARAPAPAPGARAHLAVRVGVAPNAFASPDALAAETAWVEAMSLLRARFARQGVTVHVAPPVPLGISAPDPLYYGPDDREAIRRATARVWPDLAADGATRFVPVVLAPCLIRRGDLGREEIVAATVPYIPGGAGLLDEGGADAVFMTTGTCGISERPVFEAVWGDPTRLEALLTHEIAHYLGLHHADADAGADLLADGQPPEDNLMYSLIAGVLDPDRLSLSLAQWDVVTRSPVVWFTTTD